MAEAEIVESPFRQLSLGEPPDQSAFKHVSGLKLQSRNLESVFNSLRPNRRNGQDRRLVSLHRMRNPSKQASPNDFVERSTTHPQTQLIQDSAPRTTTCNLQKCLDLLSVVSPDSENNQDGLTMLSSMMNRHTTFILNDNEFPSIDLSSNLVHGGTEFGLREALLPFLREDGRNQDEYQDEIAFITDTATLDKIWRSPVKSTASDDGTISFGELELDSTPGSEDESFESVENENLTGGHHWLRGPSSLHAAALRILAAALQNVEFDTGRLDLQCGFWESVICTLVDNVESDHNPEVTGYSLRCLRILQSLEPATISPLLRQTLLPFLYHLQAYGERNDHPIIDDEASRILEVCIFR